MPLAIKGHCLTIDSLFSRLETNVQKKEKRIKEKKFALVAKFFCCGRAYSTDLIGHILSASELRRKKSRRLDELTYSVTTYQSTDKECMVWL